MKRSKAADDGTLVVALASVLGNIGQALRNQDLTTQASNIAKQRDHLMGLWRDLHAALQQERIRSTQLASRVRELEDQVQRSLDEANRLRQENTTLHASLSKLEVGSGKGRR